MDLCLQVCLSIPPHESKSFGGCVSLQNIYMPDIIDKRRKDD